MSGDASLTESAARASIISYLSRSSLSENIPSPTPSFCVMSPPLNLL
jgi:hypothetical protein